MNAKPIMDLRTNAIDLGLDPSLPGSRDRAKAMANALLAYCASCASNGDGEYLAVVDLLSKAALQTVEVDPDPDSPTSALEEAEEQETNDSDPASNSGAETLDLFGTDPASGKGEGASKKRGMSVKELNRKAVENFTHLMAQSHGLHNAKARSKQFAGVLDVWEGPRGGRSGGKAEALMLLGGQKPQDPALAEAWESAERLTTPEAWARWVDRSQISKWGPRRGSTQPYVPATIALSKLMELALRIYVREKGYERGVPDEQLSLLLGDVLFLKNGNDGPTKTGLMKGYEVSLSFDTKGRLLVNCFRRVQALGKLNDSFGSASPDDPMWPQLQCQAVSRSLKRDATRLGSDLLFYVAPKGGSQSTQASRIEAFETKYGDLGRAKEENLRHERSILRSGIVLANKAQDLVEHCLEASLGKEEFRAVRFQPTLKRQVMVEARSKNAEVKFLADSLPGLQIIYCEELACHPDLERIHSGLIAKLAPKLPAAAVSRLKSFEDDSGVHPVLMVQYSTSAITQRKAKVSSSAFFDIGNKGARTLTGNFTNNALRMREKAIENRVPWSADPYTELKLKLYDEKFDKWRAIQGINLESSELADLLASKNEVELHHKLQNVSHELKYKHHLLHKQSFELGTAWRSTESASREGKRFVCLYGQSPKGAPARVVVFQYSMEGGALHTSKPAIGVYRMPKEERKNEGRPKRVKAKQLWQAYKQALELCPGNWARRLGLFIDDLAEREELQGETLMIYSPEDGHLLRESEEGYRGMTLLGDTWRDFPFTDILKEGPAEGPNARHLARSADGAVARHLLPVTGADVLLEPQGQVINGIRVLHAANSKEKNNNPLISWEVLVREEGTGRISRIDSPHTTEVFGSFVDTLTDDLVRSGRVSRTPLTGKIAKILVRN